MLEINNDTPGHELVKLLQTGDNRSVDRVLLLLHRQVYPVVTSFVRKHHGSDADCEDLFQDGLVALYRLAIENKLNKEEINLGGYLFAICRNIWFKQFRKKKDTVEIFDNDVAVPLEELALFSMMEQEKQTAIMDLLTRLGDSCKRLLIFYFYDRLKLKKIATLMDYSSEAVAKNKKSSCMKKLKTLIEQLPSIKNKIS